MYKAPQPEFLQSFWDSAFDLEHHLAEFLQLDPQALSQQLDERRYAVADVSHHFDWEQVADFYRDQVGSAYLFELAFWHLSSRDYIGSTLSLVADQAKGHVLDFGGGIGTHAIAAALCPDVERVTYVDINPTNRAFVQTRIRELGLEKKLYCQAELDLTESFDTVLCFDVIEHLPNPSYQLLEFHKVLQPEGRIILNWCFFKGYNNEYPTHMDDPVVVNTFLQTLQHNFLEVYHPHLITTRCYRKVIHK